MDAKAQTPKTPQEMLAEAIRQSAFLLVVSCSAFSKTRIDKQASKKSDRDHNAIEGAGKTIINRLAGIDHTHNAIVAKQEEIRAHWRAMTQRWHEDRGPRLMANANLGRWAVGHKRLMGDFKALVDKIEAEADEVCRVARQNLGSYQIELATPEQLKGAYMVSHEPSPIPNGADFGSSLPDAARAAFARQTDTLIAARVSGAIADALERVKKPVAHMVERFTEILDHIRKDAHGQATGKRPPIFDSMIENIKGIAEMLDSFNLTGDPRITELSKKLQRLTTLDAEACKKNTDVLEAAVKDGKEILDDLDDMIIPGL